MLFAYFGPETMMPVGSVLVAVAGVVMMFGRSIGEPAPSARTESGLGADVSETGSPGVKNAPKCAAALFPPERTPCGWPVYAVLTTARAG